MYGTRSQSMEKPPPNFITQIGEKPDSFTRFDNNVTYMASSIIILMLKTNKQKHLSELFLQVQTIMLEERLNYFPIYSMESNNYKII